ncbi:MAG: hypothetical protein JKY23_04085 [Nitrospinaceae bacterium]|nr:hypothetical protein [Nitrospinaceae bacterium]
MDMDMSQEPQLEEEPPADDQEMPPAWADEEKKDAPAPDAAREQEDREVPVSMTEIRLSTVPCYPGHTNPPSGSGSTTNAICLPGLLDNGRDGHFLFAVTVPVDLSDGTQNLGESIMKGCANPAKGVDVLAWAHLELSILWGMCKLPGVDLSSVNYSVQLLSEDITHDDATIVALRFVVHYYRPIELVVDPGLMKIHADRYNVSQDQVFNHVPFLQAMRVEGGHSLERLVEVFTSDPRKSPYKGRVDALTAYFEGSVLRPSDLMILLEACASLLSKSSNTAPMLMLLPASEVRTKLLSSPPVAMLIAVADSLCQKYVRTFETVYEPISVHTVTPTRTLKNYVRFGSCGSGVPSLGAIDLVSDKRLVIGPDDKLCAVARGGQGQWHAVGGARVMWNRLMPTCMGYHFGDDCTFARQMSPYAKRVNLDTRFDYHDSCRQLRLLKVHPKMCEPTFFFMDVDRDNLSMHLVARRYSAPCLWVQRRRAAKFLFDTGAPSLPDSLVDRETPGVSAVAFTSLFRIGSRCTDNPGEFLTAPHTLDHLRRAPVALRAVRESAHGPDQVDRMTGAMIKSCMQKMQNFVSPTLVEMSGHPHSTEVLRQRCRWNTMVSQSLRRLQVQMGRAVALDGDPDSQSFHMHDLSALCSTQPPTERWATNTHTEGRLTTADAVAIDAFVEEMAKNDDGVMPTCPLNELVVNRPALGAVCLRTIRGTHDTVLGFARVSGTEGVGSCCNRFINAHFAATSGRKEMEEIKTPHGPVRIFPDAMVFLEGEIRPLTSDLSPAAEVLGRFVEDCRSAVLLEDVLDIPVTLILGAFTGQMNVTTAQHMVILGASTSGKTLTASVLEHMLSSDIVLRISIQSRKGGLTGDESRRKCVVFFNEIDAQAMGCYGDGDPALNIMLNSLEATSVRAEINMGNDKIRTGLTSNVSQIMTNTANVVLVTSNINSKTVADPVMKRFTSTRHMPPRIRNYMGMASAAAITKTTSHGLMRSLLFDIHVLEDMVIAGALPVVGMYTVHHLISTAISGHNDSLSSLSDSQKDKNDDDADGGADAPGGGPNPTHGAGGGPGHSAHRMVNGKYQQQGPVAEKAKVFDALYNPRHRSVVSNAIGPVLVYMRLLMLNKCWLKAFWACNPNFGHTELCVVVAMNAVATPGDAMMCMNATAGFDSFREFGQDRPLSHVVVYDLVTSFLLMLWGAATMAHTCTTDPWTAPRFRSFRQEGTEGYATMGSVFYAVQRGDVYPIETMLRWPRRAFMERCNLWLVVCAARWARGMGPLLAVVSGVGQTFASVLSRGGPAARGRNWDADTDMAGSSLYQPRTSSSQSRAPPRATRVVNDRFKSFVWSRGMRTALIVLQSCCADIERIVSNMTGSIASQAAKHQFADNKKPVLRRSSSAASSSAQPHGGSMPSADVASAWDDIMNTWWQDIRRDVPEVLQVSYFTNNATTPTVDGMHNIWRVVTMCGDVLSKMRVSKTQLDIYHRKVQTKGTGAMPLITNFFTPEHKWTERDRNAYSARFTTYIHVKRALEQGRSPADESKQAGGSPSVASSGHMERLDADLDPAMQRSRWTQDGVHNTSAPSAEYNTVATKALSTTLQCLMKNMSGATASAHVTTKNMLRLGTATVVPVLTSDPTLGCVVKLDLGNLSDVSTSPVVAAVRSAVKQYTDQVAAGEETPLCRISENCVLSPSINGHLNKIVIPGTDAEANVVYDHKFKPETETRNSTLFSRLLETGKIGDPNGAKAVGFQGTAVECAHNMRRNLHSGVYGAYRYILGQSALCYVKAYKSHMCPVKFVHADQRSRDACDGCNSLESLIRTITDDMDAVQTSKLDARVFIKRYMPSVARPATANNEYPVVFMSGSSRRTVAREKKIVWARRAEDPSVPLSRTYSEALAKMNRPPARRRALVPRRDQLRAVNRARELELAAQQRTDEDLRYDADAVHRAVIEKRSTREKRNAQDLEEAEDAANARVDKRHRASAGVRTAARDQEALRQQLEQDDTEEEEEEDLQLGDNEWDFVVPDPPPLVPSAGHRRLVRPDSGDDD